MSKTSPWFKLETADYLTGTEGLTWEEQGAFMRLLVLMYDRDGPLPDDDRIMARMLLGDIRTWRRVKASLTTKGKIKVTSAGIINDRAMKEIRARHNRADKAAEAAAARWSVSEQNGDSCAVATPELSDSYPIATEELSGHLSEKPNEINGTTYANAMPYKKEKKKEIKKEKNTPLVPPARAGRTRAKEGYPDWFERFWRAYPGNRKQLKAKCFDLASQAVKRGDAVIDQFAEAVNEGRAINEDPQYQMAPERWLRNRGWLDEPTGNAAAMRDGSDVSQEEVDRLLREHQEEQDRIEREGRRDLH
jgi:uncharacterized protein YdaU (DUF1376 family)